MAMTEPKNEQQPTPAVKGGVVAYLALDGANKAAAFYEKAFGAEIAGSQPVDDKGRTMHVHLYINGSSVMLGDFYPEYGHAAVAPQGFTMHLMVADVDAGYKRAIDAGAESVLEPQVMFWGDRYAQVRDPFGVIWAFVGQNKEA